MTDPLVQIGIPGTSEMVIVLFVLGIAIVPAVAIYWDASRRGASYPPVRAVATFFAAWTLVGVVVVALLSFVLVVTGDTTESQ